MYIPAAWVSEKVFVASKIVGSNKKGEGALLGTEGKLLEVHQDGIVIETVMTDFFGPAGPKAFGWDSIQTVTRLSPIERPNLAIAGNA